MYADLHRFVFVLICDIGLAIFVSPLILMLSPISVTEIIINSIHEVHSSLVILRQNWLCLFFNIYLNYKHNEKSYAAFYMLHPCWACHFHRLQKG